MTATTIHAGIVQGQCLGSVLIAQGITSDHAGMPIDPGAIYDFEHMVGQKIALVWRSGLKKPKGKQLEIPPTT